MKKMLSLVLAVAIMVCVIPFGTLTLTASAATEHTSGYYTYTVLDGKATITDVDKSISGDITIPSTLGGYTVVSMGEGAFDWCNSLTKLTIPSGIISIGDRAFSSCDNLTNIILPDSVKYIGDRAFLCCDKLQNINIDEKNKYYSSINGVLFNKNKTSLLFYPTGRTATSFSVPDSVTSIGDAAFYWCTSLTSVTIPNSIISIGEGAFFCCRNLTSATIPDGIISIAEDTFSGCYKLMNLDIPNSVTSIGNNAFRDCKNLTSIVIPNSVKSIGESAFSWCSGLTNITLPASITNIDYGVFDCCSSLMEVTIPNGVTSIGAWAFWGCEKLKNIIIPNSVTQIDDLAFCGCTNLKNVYYRGNKSDKEKILIGSDNFSLTSATWYYNSCIGPKTHTYTDSCDKSCNVCKTTRKIKHSYDNSCDTKCNVCKTTRSITHKYTTTTTKATLSKNGSIVKKCTVCGKVASKSTIKCAKTFKLSSTSYTYNGKVKTPIVTVKDSAGNKLKKNVDYTLSSSSGRKNVGTYKVTIKMKGKYSGTKTLTFKINPVKTSVSKLTAGKKSITVNISKKSTQVSGYQVQYSTSKKFINAKTKTISSYKTTKYTLKSLSAKKIYYVRVRTYKTVSGKKYYSGWSSYKYIKTK